MFSRYAIYYTPPPGAFAQLGAAWLGWDLASGTAVAQPEIAGVDLKAVTDAPRKYGLHGTIKAPFPLAGTETEQDLSDALANFCKRRSPFALRGLALSRIGRFLALTPAGDASELGALAADVVRGFDRFRAPMAAAEFTRKNKPNLTDQQRDYLRAWGYPHVFDLFRFHITLSGPLAQADRTTVHAVLDDFLGPAVPVPFNVDSLTLCGEAADGRFHEVARFPFEASQSGQ